jgi:hypothetical protein
MPHIHNGKAVPGDPRHGTRWATEGERRIALLALRDLEVQFLKIALLPAPVESFPGQKVRALASRNPKWYERFVAGRWDRRGCQVKRVRVERALRRVTAQGIVRRNGYEVEILKFYLTTPETTLYSHASTREGGPCRQSMS